MGYRKQDDASTLQSLIEKLKSERDVSFAQSLVGQSMGGRPLSEKQMFWVVKLCRRARGEDEDSGRKLEAPVAPAEQQTAIDGLISMFARTDMFQPKLLVRVGEVTIKFKACKIYTGNKLESAAWEVTVAAPKFGGAYYGKIIGGKFHAKRDALPAGTWEALAAFLKDPAAKAREYGHAEHHCCYCAEGLTDPRSKTAGCGPVCAKRYQLPWGQVAPEYAEEWELLQLEQGKLKNRKQAEKAVDKEASAA